LMSSVKDVNAIPRAGMRLVIVAAVDHVLYFRIFDSEGKMVVDTDATRWTAQAAQIEDLRKQLAKLSPSHELTRSEKDRVIDAVTSIVGYTRLSTIRITDGLVREVKNEEDKLTYRIVNPHELVIETDSVVPCTEVGVGAISQLAAAKIGIRPMAATTLKSSHKVSIKRHDVSPDKSSFDTQFKPVRWMRKSFPEALWSDKAASDEPEARMIEDVPSGVVLRVVPNELTHHVGPFPINNFANEWLNDKNIAWSLAAPLPTPITKEAMSEVLAGRLRDDKPRRNNIRNCLVNHWNCPEQPPVSGRDARWNVFALTRTSEKPFEHFQAPPTCAALGQSL
jgi:hypothetical protein